MNFIKRATTSILRRPGKSIILLLLVFILGSVIAGAISVEGAISNTDANLRRNMQPIVSVDFDWIEFQDSIDWDTIEDGVDPWRTQPRLTPEDIRSIGALSYVDFYDYMIMGGLQSFELERYQGGESWRQEGVPDWFNLRGASRETLVKIDEGIIDLVQGNQFSAADLVPGGNQTVAIISESFAQQNNLSIGSTFEMYNIVHVPNEDETFFWSWTPEVFADEHIHELVGMEFQVVGLYDVPLDPDAEQYSQEYWERRDALNNIYVPNWALEDIQRRTFVSTREAWADVDWEPEFPAFIDDSDEPETRVVPIFIIEDPRFIDDFREAATPMLPDFHNVIDLSSSFDDIASSMATMQDIANWILYVSIGATLLILSLLITLFLRDRRYEMGVYLALGEKKGKIVTQLLMEVLVTSVVAITLSVFVGNIISGTISRNMLSNELMVDANDDPWGWSGREWTVFNEIGIPTNSMSVDEMMENFDVSLNIQTIGLFYVIGLGAVVLSTLVPVIYVVTLNPKKVLM